LTNEVERFADSFGQKMSDMIANGVNFEQIFRKTLIESMGETPAEVFLRWLSPSAFEDPRTLYSEVRRHFGSGAVSICRLVEENAEKELLDSKNEEEPSILMRFKDMPMNGLATPGVTQQAWRSLERFGSSDRMNNAISGHLFSAEATGNRISFARGRAFLLDSDAWTSARKKLLSSEAGAAMVREIWAQYGETIGLKARQAMGQATDLALDAFEDIIEDSGIARIQIRGDKLYGTNLTVRVDNCVLCAGRRPDGVRQCAEFLGILQGFTGALFGARTVEESPCNGSGETCTFQVGRKGTAGGSR
jgi:hypothetical protein